MTTILANSLVCSFMKPSGIQRRAPATLGMNSVRISSAAVNRKTGLM